MKQAFFELAPNLWQKKMECSGTNFMNDLLESAYNGMIVVDTKGGIVIFNRAARRVAGLTKERIKGRALDEILPQAWSLTKELLTTGEPQIGRKLKLRETTILVNQTAIRRGGRITWVLTVFQDASDHEKALKELALYKQRNDELDVIFNFSYDGLWISDAEGKVVKINPVSERFTGVKAEKVLGRHVRELVAEGYFEPSATLEVLKHRTAVSVIQTSKDGRQVLATGNPVFDENGDIRMVVINARDLTGIMKLKAELKESRALAHQYRSELTHLHRHEELRSQMVLQSPPMRRVFDMSMRVARVDSNVLIHGESGVGKSLLAKIIHQTSPRQNGPLIQVDCGAIPPSLIEAELFGYVKGAFTGALAEGKPGYFELAEGGTLFLDEISELPSNTQAKLLRFLESNEVVRVGDTSPRRIDVRILAATNRDLEAMVECGEFRKDLFFRLNVVPINIPPLRQRVEDIPHLVNHFLRRFNQSCSCFKTISPAAVDCLCSYDFPGNIRELANLIERMVVLTPEDSIGLEDLPAAMRAQKSSPDFLLNNNEWNLPIMLEQVEKELISRALAEYGSQRKAAHRLGISHSTLSRKARRYGVKPLGMNSL